MQLEFIELRTQAEIVSEELRARAREFPGRAIDLRYLVLKAGKEVAVLWYNTFPTEFYLAIYELFVDARFRHQGIGSALIHHAETLATARGYRQILVRPQPLSDEITQEQLVAWYEKRGFTKMTDDDGTRGRPATLLRSSLTGRVPGSYPISYQQRFAMRAEGDRMEQGKRMSAPRG